METVKRVMSAPYGAPLRWAHRGAVRAQLGGVAGVDRFRARHTARTRLAR